MARVNAAAEAGAYDTMAMVGHSASMVLRTPGGVAPPRVDAEASVNAFGAGGPERSANK